MTNVCPPLTDRAQRFPARPRRCRSGACQPGRGTPHSPPRPRPTVPSGRGRFPPPPLSARHSGRGGRGGRAPSGRQEVNGKRRLLPPTPQCRSRLLLLQQQQQRQPRRRRRVTSARLSRAALPAGRRALTAGRRHPAADGRYLRGRRRGCGDIGRRLLRGRRRGGGGRRREGERQTGRQAGRQERLVPAASASQPQLALPVAGRAGSALAARRGCRGALSPSFPLRRRAAGGSGL